MNKAEEISGLVAELLETTYKTLVTDASIFVELNRQLFRLLDDYWKEKINQWNKNDWTTYMDISCSAWDIYIKTLEKDEYWLYKPLSEVESYRQALFSNEKVKSIYEANNNSVQ